MPIIRMHSVDGLLIRAISLKALAIIILIFIPFLLSGITFSQATTVEETNSEEQHVSSNNPVFIAGEFQYFDLTLTVDEEKICIIAYSGDSIPDPCDRSVENYYRWEYDQGTWKDLSDHDLLYIEPSKCSKENNTYFFYIGIDHKANPGHWTIKVIVDEKEVSSTPSLVMISGFTFFLSSIIGVFKPTIGDKKYLVDMDFICSDRKRIMAESEKNVDILVGKILSKHNSPSKKEKAVDDILDLSPFNSKLLTQDELVKSTVTNYPKGRLKKVQTNELNSFFINEKGDEDNRFWKNKSAGYEKLLAIIATIILLSIVFMPVITSNNTDDPPIITIINVQSYPVVGGEWVVMFNTRGRANLTITAVNGTTWSNIDNDHDLKFLELKCGNKTYNSEWMNNSVFIANYSSNETGYETSKVLTSGMHTLMFRFGDDVAFANNLASEYWLQTSTSDFNNGTKNNVNVSDDAFHLNKTHYIRNTTLINNESFEGDWPPNGWSEVGLLEQWNAEDDRNHSGIYSADFDGGMFWFFEFSGNLISPTMNCSNSTATAIYVDSWNYEDGADNGDYYLDYYDGSNWDQIRRLDNFGSGSWVHYTNKITELQYFVSNFQIRWRVVALGNGEYVYVDDVTVKLEKNESGYVTTGSLVSKAHDTGQISPIYTNITLNSTIPSGTNTISWIRAANTETNLSNATWHTDISQVAHKQWVQWRINLTGDEDHTPTVYDVNLTWNIDDEKPTSCIDTISPYWQNSNSFEITATASDNDTGVKEVALYYNYSANNASGWSGWTLYGSNDTSSPYNWSFNHSSGDGYYRFYSNAIDNENNVENPPTLPNYDTICGVDTANPSSKVDNIFPYWYNDSTKPVIINVSSASDPLSGLKNLWLYYRYRTDNSSSWTSWASFSVDENAPWSWSFNFPKAKGQYQFYSIAVDNASNYEDPPFSPDNDTECGYNSTKPYSEVDEITPYWCTISPLTITSQATDFSDTGLHNVTLYYYNSSDNNSWYGPWTFGVDTNPWVDISWNYNFPNGDGYYKFYSIAEDNSSNSEDFTGNDTNCGYDTAKPSSQIDTITPYWYDSSDNPITITVTNPSENLSGLTNITLYYCYRENNGSSWGSWVSFGKNNFPPWSWNFNFPNNEGHYQFHSIANDTAGNQEDPPAISDAHCGYDTSKPSSSVDTISPYNVTYSPFSIRATASDDVKNVTLWYRWSADNHSWGTTADTITVDNTSSSEGATVSSMTWSHTIGNHDNRTLVVCSAVNEDSSDNWPNQVNDWNITDITYNGVALNSADSEIVTDSSFWTYYYTSSEIWYLHNPDAGNHEIRINYSGTVNYCSVGAISLYNVLQQAPEATNTNTRKSSSLISTSISTLSDGAMVLDVVACGDNRNFAPGTGQTEFFDNNTAGSGGAGSHKLIQSAGATSMVQTASSSANRMSQVVLSFASTVSQNGINWTEWNNASNPDTSYPWSWNFNFPNGSGYYQFYSIARDNMDNIEDPPTGKDAACYYNPALSSSPVINFYNLMNSTGSKLNNATGLLDVNNEYYFTIKITDSNGWMDIDYIEIKAWYDNGSESTTYNQTQGGNLNMHLQYENTTGTASFNLLWPDDEVQIIFGNCTENIINETTGIINISFKPRSQVRWASSNDTWNTAQNTTNDPYSWNFNITVIDSSGLKAWKKDEYGIYKFTSILPNQDWVNVIAPPGFWDDSSVVTITYSSNYNFNMTICFEENLTNATLGDTISIANNVYVLGDADSNDDITYDVMFAGIGEANAIDIFNDSGIFHSSNISQIVNVQFDVYIPIGTQGGKYTARVATKIIQD